jgi:hypothetical protein
MNLDDKAMKMITGLSSLQLSFFSRYFDRDKLARHLYHSLGSPSIKNFTSNIRMNSIEDDDPVTTENIEIAEAVQTMDA